MAITLNASTSSGLVQTADTSGVIDLQSNGSTKLTINSSGVSTPLGSVAINGPAFLVYPSASSTNLTSSTWTKVTLDTEVFDTNNNFASSRFTPTVAGYYQITFQCYCSSSGNNAYWQWISIYKNGSAYISNSNVNGSGALQSFSWNLSPIIYMNGSTDYLEFYVNIYVASGTPAYAGGSGAINTFASGSLVRGA